MGGLCVVVYQEGVMPSERTHSLFEARMRDDRRIAGSKKHSTWREGGMMARAGDPIWVHPDVVEALRGLADKAGGKNRQLILVVAHAIEKKDKKAASRVYAKIPSDVRQKFIPVAVRGELG